jgi:hypothetical protein
MILSKTGAFWVIVISIPPLSFYLRHRLLNIAVELNRVIGNYNEVARCWNRPNGGCHDFFPAKAAFKEN